jgi:DNA repair protein RecO (recombination protein O)
MNIKDRLYRTDAIILRRSDFGEADRLLTVFSREFGKLRLLAKGVRKTNSRKAGHIELFMLTNMLVAQGRTWDIISQADIVEAYRDIREDLDKPSHAYYLAELIDRFTEEHDPNQPLFELFAFTLARLAHTDDPFVVLRHFELHLLGLAGYQPQLHFCAVCQEPLEPVKTTTSIPPMAAPSALLTAKSAPTPKFYPWPSSKCCATASGAVGKGSQPASHPRHPPAGRIAAAGLHHHRAGTPAQKRRFFAPTAPVRCVDWSPKAQLLEQKAELFDPFVVLPINSNLK